MNKVQKPLNQYKLYETMLKQKSVSITQKVLIQKTMNTNHTKYESETMKQSLNTNQFPLQHDLKVMNLNTYFHSHEKINRT